jgi:hypothetical protein
MRASLKIRNPRVKTKARIIVDNCQTWPIHKRAACKLKTGYGVLRALLTSKKPLRSMGDVFLKNYVDRVLYANVEEVAVSFDEIEKVDLEIIGLDTKEKWREDAISFIMDRVQGVSNGNKVIHKMIENSLADASRNVANDRLRELKLNEKPTCLED